ncbi:hypothetical protein P154DRAFT_452187, partial [Amniculicola lignicola CBS 123094]
YTFNTNLASSLEAIGFIVDKGYILTNRYIIRARPFTSYYIFYNYKEYNIYLVYYNPMYNFSILYFNPKNIKYMSLSTLKLYLDLTKVGIEI